jgi:hypothetical protein
MSSGLQDSLGFAVASYAIGKEHRPELATNEMPHFRTVAPEHPLVAVLILVSGNCRDEA